VSANVSDEAETARIQKYLDAFYKPSDVAHSFRSRFGEDIDCIDFYAYPTVRAMTARGEHVEIPTSLPLPPPSASALHALEEVGFTGEADEGGHARRCPGTTVPMVRKTMAEIKGAGGLAKYLQGRAHHAAPPPPSGSTAPPDVAGFFHVVAKYPLDNLGAGPSCGLNGGCLSTVDSETPPCPSGQPACPFDPVFGGSAVLSLHAPVPDPNGHSLAQTWTFSGAKQSNLTSCQQCTTDCTQSIEMGWIVDPAMFPQNNPNSPHLFVYSTQDGYWNTGAYVNEPGPPPNCACVGLADSNCAACIVTANDAFIPLTPKAGQPQITAGMTISKANGLVDPSQLPQLVNGQLKTFTPTELTFATTWTNLPFVGPTWVLSVNGVAFGFYPGSAFRTSAVPTNGTLANAATYFWAGGEVSGEAGTAFNAANPSVGQMGSGYGAPLGFGWSAYIRNFEFFGQNIGGGSIATYANTLFTIAETNPNCYNVGAGFSGIPAVGSPNPGGSNWGNYMYYGGLGHQCGPGWSSFPGSCDACCTFVPSNIETTPGVCPGTLQSSQACDSYCNQPPPAMGETPFQQLKAQCGG
jgi:hypothetical protein